MTEQDLKIQELKAENRRLLEENQKIRESQEDLISRSQAICMLESNKKGFENCVSNMEVQLNKEWNKAVAKCIESLKAGDKNDEP